jgi:hypothetical protein
MLCPHAALSLVIHITAIAVESDKDMARNNFPFWGRRAGCDAKALRAPETGNCFGPCPKEGWTIKFDELARIQGAEVGKVIKAVRIELQ